MFPHPIFHKPPALTPGDVVAVIAPAGPFDRPSFEAGLAALEGRYTVRYGSDVFEQHRYLAGADVRRLEELNRALRDPTIRGIFCARGGYGSLRLLAGIAPGTGSLTDWAKPVVGFSDITALHQWCQQNGLISFHGPGLTQLGRQTQAVRSRLFSL